MTERSKLTAPPATRPVLENGDAFTAREFLGRYRRMPDVKKAELIDGVVYMASPVSAAHSEPHFDLTTWLGVYRAATPHVRGRTEPTLRLSRRAVFQPDALLGLPASSGGKSSLDGKGYTVGAPELVAEVAKSTVSIDAGRKRRAYEKHGVAEYVLWRVEDEAIDWWTLVEGKYQPIAADPADGLLKSFVYPGLWLDRAALLKSDMAAVLAALQRGLASPGHAEFAARLRAAAN